LFFQNHMNFKAGFILIFILVNRFFGFTQPVLLPLADVDSSFVRKYSLKNDLRLIYGMQGNNLSLGSRNEGDPSVNGNIYTNTNDYLGMGMTYKWLDGDFSFSLPGTTYLHEERSNLTQFKLGMSYTLRKIAFRGYVQDSKGVVVSGANNEFQTAPTLHERKWGLQITYLFNSTKYSYRAALYQSEFQMKTAGSFLFRIEPFYRNLGGQSGSMIPTTFDTPERYGDQAGLEYIKAPGVLFMPGYGINIAIPNTPFFISPMVFAGVGAAFNSYQSNNGKNSYTNFEYAANFNLNAGYNGSRYYSKIQFYWSAGYSPLDPSYLSSNNLTLVVTAAFRFRDIETSIPRNF
jgi:Domain of unknown function (DUF4421)